MNKFKTIYKKIKTSIIDLWKKIEIFFIDLYGWIRSLWILMFCSIKTPHTFYGFSVWWFATNFARKRDRRWKANWDQNGKRQGIIPIADTKIIVCSKLEVKLFQRRGALKRTVNYNHIFKKATYFKTDMDYGNIKKGR